MSESRANTFLQMIRRSERGRLKVYLGYGPGVGKTYQMLQEGHRIKADGIDVVVGLIETHGRAETAKLVDGLEILPRRKVEYHGIVIDEFDLDGCLARKPQVAIVDELAHTNVPGSRNAKRYEDVQELLAAGIHVITALNIQHLESLYNTVESLVGVKVRERIPDSVLADADQVVNIDVAPEDLQQRLESGKIYPKERIVSSLNNFFRVGNLEHLRELALRELASQIDSRRRTAKEDGAAGAGTDQIMVCLSSRGPNSARLLRFGSRLAGRLNRNWYAVYVQTPLEDPTRIDAVTQRLLADTLTLANQLGATVFTFKGQDVAETIMRFASEYRVGQIVIGKPHLLPWWRRLKREKTVAEELIFQASGVTITVVDADAQEVLASDLPTAPTSEAPTAKTIAVRATLGQLLTPEHIRVWNDPVSKEQVFRDLVTAALVGQAGVSVETVLRKLAERESQGSTFLNEGVALPHARVEGLAAPLAALGLTHVGVLDSTSEKPIEAVFLMLSPADQANSHLQLLAAAGRMLQNRDIRKQLQAADAPAEVAAIIADAGRAAAARNNGAAK